MKMSRSVRCLCLASLVGFAGSTFAAEGQQQGAMGQQRGSAQKEQSRQAMQSGVEKGTTFESVSISFEPGSTVLTEQDKETLRNQLMTMKEQGAVSRAKIAVWSDKEHPQRGDLSKADRDLAQRRISSVESFLKSQEGVSKVTSFNMAENRHWLGRMFHREQADLDAAFAKRGEAPISNHEFKAIKEQGGPSKAIVILEHKVKP